MSENEARTLVEGLILEQKRKLLTVLRILEATDIQNRTTSGESVAEEVA